ncbi:MULTISPECIES: DUF2789 domain-containing protein [Pseudomonas]|jgi:hypothetical protein|uniref:DUF2789 domain-containing protein n=1 Tax=Pseudomonas sp. Hg7Tf TaxID=3236988 RepID=A0AB39HZG6_9PSED|nr:MULTISPECIES: DUF2789 domain-containing protein [Pseudomonas]KJK09554.1 hypothetical protein UB47_03170 [Pseudomonas sp. 5]MDD1976622.1 DUF2789 domain-containing protein [Pseudomonas putida]MDH2560758.1 DUF2789 domain-containing protein [Pseudomonas sp. Hg5Tf]QYX46584.1 DUF2789 domain-containing protein [Pseudomonas sp. S11A 273]
MEAPTHKFSDLFKQLGLPDDPVGIDQFLTSHSPLKGDIKLVDAPFWTPSQKAFLQESVTEDSDWAVPFDQLNEALRNPKK